MKEIFLTISKKIESLSPEVRWVDFDLGQLEVENPPVSFPCVLISFESADFDDLSQGSQQAEVFVNLRIAFKKFERTHSKATESFRLLGLKHLDTIEAIHRVVNGVSGTDFSKLLRRTYSNEKRSDFRVYNLGYSTLFRDDPPPTHVAFSEVHQKEHPDLCLPIRQVRVD